MKINQFYKGTSLLKKEIKFNQYQPNKFESIAQVSKEDIDEEIAPYIPSEELIEAVNYAKLLKRPLLIRGEPGCGKTKLAQAIAHELFEEKKKSGKVVADDNYRNHYFEWFIKSTSKAIDGVYTFDHLGRLRDAQLLSSYGPATEDHMKLKEKKATDYRHFKPLGKAFLASKKEYPAVLLIDEIDKADIDFPNDLLLELDQKRFFIPETNEEYKAEEAPVIIITSNDERELPNAFLRRCVFHYINFLEKDKLIEILQGRSSLFEKQYTEEMNLLSVAEYTEKLKEKNLEDEPKQADLIAQLVDKFIKIRKVANADPNIRKLPSTSEMIDWYRVVHHHILFDKSFQVDDDDFLKKVVFQDVLFKNLDDAKIATKLNL